MLVSMANINIVKYRKEKNVYVLRYTGNNNIKKIYTFLYEDAFTYLDRKRNKMYLYCQ
jgi:hypothetical protein